jgi:hypothetical protein
VSLTYVIAESGKSWWLATKDGGAGGTWTNCLCRETSFGDSVAKNSFLVVTAAGAVAVLRLSRVALSAVVDGCGAFLSRLLPAASFGSIAGRKVLRKRGLARTEQQEAVRVVLGRVCCGAFMGSEGCSCTPAGVVCMGCACVGVSVEVVAGQGFDTGYLDSLLCGHALAKHAAVTTLLRSSF